MDFLFYSQNKTLPIPWYVCQQTVKVADVLSNILIVFLIIYRVRKGKEEVKDFHEPIFQQLFYIAGGIVAVRNMFWIMKLLNIDETWSTFFVLLCASVWSVDNVLINTTLMFTFLAALQRIVIMYRPKWKHLLTGKPLTWLIVTVWLLNFVQPFIKAVFSEQSFNNVTLSFRLLFFLSTVASNLIYYHFYKLMSNFTDQHQYHKMHLLYQFVPIHTILTIFTFIQLTMEFVLFTEIYNEFRLPIYLYSGVILIPFIPTVISLSYIASRNNLRALITAVLRPIWDDITG